MVTMPTRLGPDDVSASAAPLTLAEVERRHIAATLERTGWHQGRAADALGISVKTLYRKIRSYGFQRPGARTR
jgi:DNA-binding NtrC family response regulator